VGDLRPDNGGGKPPDDGSRPQHLPGIPPEWGIVVIPDDASELDEEAVALRREMRRESRQARLRSVFGAGPQAQGQAPSFGVPVVIMAVAVLTTLVSLFVVTWGRQPRQPVPIASLTTGWQGANSGAVPSLSDIVLPDATGGSVRLGSLLPAVVLLTDGCDCADLVIGVATAAPAGVTVVRVGRTAPSPIASVTPSAPANVRSLTDPEGVLRSRYAGEASHETNANATGSAAASAESARPTAILLDDSGLVTSTISALGSVAELEPGLRRLVGD
jgi:hypothetical protein